VSYEQIWNQAFNLHPDVDACLLLSPAVFIGWIIGHQK
jgi:hypothetical protein